MLRQQQKHQRCWNLLAPTALANIKHSNSQPEYTNPHIQGLLPQFLEPIKHVWLSMNIRKPAKREENIKSEDTEQVSEPDLDMTQMLKLSDRKFKVTMNNMLKSLMEKYKIM